MTSPFDDESASFAVLRNDRAQHSLWPGALPGPDGWHQVFGPASRAECEEYVTEHWTDLTRA
ncbi:MbtH family protein [Saccharopolyspora sp. MS10]|uniref:MbtH family protein n=1 Tax=Saccharopolyspora sp. MS10 TaxID=3385973 RepID=UPI0039A01695